MDSPPQLGGRPQLAVTHEDANPDDLVETLEEVGRITGGFPPVLKLVLRGNTRITGAWTHGAFEAEIRPMRDHVIWATHSGTGNATTLTDGQRVTVPNPGGAVRVIPRGHGGYWRIDGEATVSNIYLGRDRLHECADVLAEGRPFELLDHADHLDPKLYSSVKLICDEVCAPGPHGVVFLEHALDLLCLVLLRGHSTLATLAQKQRGLALWQVKRVTAYMRDRLGGDITLQELANVVSQSRFHFCTAFREATGVAPYEYLTRLRMRTACTLLRSDPLTVADVGAAVGYSSLSGFSTAFRRYCGTSPRAYRIATR
jgi:AraC family transcriptional regulator